MNEVGIIFSYLFEAIVDCRSALLIIVEVFEVLAVRGSIFYFGYQPLHCLSVDIGVLNQLDYLRYDDGRLFDAEAHMLDDVYPILLRD